MKKAFNQTNQERIVTFLKQNKKFGFTPKQLSEQLNISVRIVHNIAYRNKDRIQTETVVPKKEVYYLYNTK